MNVIIDASQIHSSTITDESGQSVEAVVIPVAIPLSDVAAELVVYLPESGTHPLASQARPLAKAWLDALLAVTGGAP